MHRTGYKLVYIKDKIPNYFIGRRLKITNPTLNTKFVKQCTRKKYIFTSKRFFFFLRTSVYGNLQVRYIA